ncbi:MAG TPA: EF-hand domain-containing protein [Sandaracinaceae bacterium LLY-WYZ-13_1]|nr:EF-hand domain-containing protein [Sandaracinaceae bacterium LLY-WYZ-13_1]
MTRRIPLLAAAAALAACGAQTGAPSSETLSPQATEPASSSVRTEARLPREPGYAPGLSLSFARWDVDGSRGLEPDELAHVLYVHADRDDDATLDRVELYRVLPADVQAPFADFDRDDSGEVSRDELADGLVRTGAFAAYDLNDDGVIGPREMDFPLSRTNPPTAAATTR